jgi:PAP2 superfamily
VAGRVTAWAERRFSLPVEAAIVAGVLVAWQAARLPLAGGVRESVAHAHEWIALHRTLGLTGLWNGIISLVHHPGVVNAGTWSYNNLHIFSIFTFMVALRAAAPERYPKVRTVFVLLHVPALVAIGVFPLAPPVWLPHPPAWPGGVPSLASSLDVSLRNQTAAVASEPFAYPVLIAAGILSAARRRPLSWLILIYPTWVFIFIVGTGHHYPLDAVVGTLCLAFGFVAAQLVHRSAPSIPAAAEPARRWVGLGLGAGLIAGWVDGLLQGRVALGHPSVLTFAPPAAVVVALAVATTTPHRKLKQTWQRLWSLQRSDGG